MSQTKVHYLPKGYHTATPYLIIAGAAAAIEFYKNAFGAKELFRIGGGPGDTIGHAEMLIGDSPIMMADECPAMSAKAPGAYGGSPISMMIYVPDADAMVARAVELGAKIVRPIQDQFYGDRSATLLDPFGHTWTIATHIEDMSPEEMTRRAHEAFGGGKTSA